MARPFTVLAIIAAHNEEDIIGQAVRHLVEQGVDVYLLDHGSTDNTVAEVRPYLGRGVVSVEAFPDRSVDTTGSAGQFTWEAILRRKQALAAELDASWFIHHDADEFREAPWPHIGLREAIQWVDGLGYNAIDFEVFNFPPTHDGFRKGDDVRAAFGFYEPARDWDKLQVKCWKRQPGVDLVSSGGHEAAFEERRVFPLRFLLRHYPIRSQAHGERKVFHERQPRFLPSERRRGWHVQYDSIAEDHRFIRNPATLTPYDPDAARLHLCLEHREVEELRRRLETVDRERLAVVHTLETVSAQLSETRGRLEDLYASRSWRWMAPLRAAYRRLFDH